MRPSRGARSGRTRGRAGRSPGGGNPGARSPAGTVGRGEWERSAGWGIRAVRRGQARSSRRVVQAARVVVRSRQRPLCQKRNGWRGGARARKGAPRTCCGTFAQPWLIALDSQTTRDGGTRVPPRSRASRSAASGGRISPFSSPPERHNVDANEFLLNRFQRICSAQTECPYAHDFFPRDPHRVPGSDRTRAAQCARAGSATGSCRPLDIERRSRAGHHV